MGVFVLVATIKFSYAGIYDSAPNVNSKPTSSCDFEQTPEEYVQAMNEGLPINTQYMYESTWSLYDSSTQYFSTHCIASFKFKKNTYQKTSAGVAYNHKEKRGSAELFGSLTTVPSCLNLDENQGRTGSDQYSILHTKEDGSSACYSPNDLAENDTCEATDADGLYESFISSESGVSCMEKPEDGSICPVKKNFEITSNATGNTSYFYEYNDSVPASSCYSQNHVNPPQPDDFDIQSNVPSEVGQCTEANGVSMCAETPSNVCDSTGNCQAGCGSIGVGDDTQFVCLSGDIDNDSIPDYLDRDKDGDGILNEQDLDSDGDGVEDAIDLSSQNIRTAHQSSIEELLGQIAQNTQGGSGGSSGSGDSQGVIDAIGELSDELEEKTTVTVGNKGSLYNQSEAEAEIEQATEKLNAKIQEIKEHFSGMLSIGSGTGSFSGCFDIAQINGSKHGGCIDEYADEMSMVAIALLFIFALISIVILLR